jgi:hypothetical protein
MRKCYRTLNAIEYAFVVSLMAAFSVMGVGGLLFGFQMSQWAEWQGLLVGVFVTIAGVVGAYAGFRLAVYERLMNLNQHGHSARWIKH